MPAAALGPPPPGVGLEVERSELVQAEDDVGLTVLGYRLTVGDRVEVLDAGPLGITSAIIPTGMPCADNSTVWARQRLSDAAPH